MVSADPPTQPAPRWLADHQSMPGDFLVGFTQALMDRRAQLLGQGHPPEVARGRAVAEAAQAFAAGADQRGWTVGQRRITQLADDTLGLEQEYRDQYGYEPELARRSATGEVLQGERAREELPRGFLPPLDPPQRLDPDCGQRHPAQRTGPDSRTDTGWTREPDYERCPAGRPPGHPIA
jgi:hypothetical protein